MKKRKCLGTTFGDGYHDDGGTTVKRKTGSDGGTPTTVDVAIAPPQ